MGVVPFIFGIEKMTVGPEAKLQGLIDGAVAGLSEHFDSVQVVCTRSETDGSWSMYMKGAGNYFARVGSVREWLLRDEEGTRKNVQEAE